IHNALPEVDFEKITLSSNFLGKKINYPIVIEAMTGGFKEALKINKYLARIAQQFNIPFGLGSQRAMLENRNDESYFVRDVAPSIPIIGNIGAFQLKKHTQKDLEWMISKVGADAIAIHLNSLQEIIQPEGDRDFSGILKKIEELCNSFSVPIIVKETGAGIDRRVAIKLKEAGVHYIDVAGSGGSSWSRVEYLRGNSISGFEEWGIPTVESILECKGILPLIASGGIRSGIDCAKSIALGAELSGAAYPFIKTLNSGKLPRLLEEWILQIKICCFLTGSKGIEGLKSARIHLKT
ncbi:MAG: type 2 isopentenyl-diphosphate Delta-isomerase, partial [Candidatus Paceibacterota bacterium]